MGCTSSSEAKSRRRGGRGRGSEDTPRPVLYVWPGSAPCRAVWMTAKAANVDVDVKTVDLLKGEHKQETFLKVGPLGVALMLTVLKT